MGADRFDTLARRLVAKGSRRTAILALASGTISSCLGIYGFEDVDAHNVLLKCMKIKDKNRKQNCIRNAKKHNRRHAGSSAPTGSLCVADCTGKQCGNDGCGGSCGRCSVNESCELGQCQCVSGFA